jgi:hypothetical protein
MNQDEFKEIISQAISQEVEAFTFYNTVSDKAKDVILKRLFKDLAQEEAKHWPSGIPGSRFLILVQPFPILFPPKTFF